MNIKPWREVATPHEDVRKGNFLQAEFAADLTRVRDGSAAAEYQDPVQFFRRTFITEGMRLLLDSVVRRLSGRGGDPVIQLQTAFGGGKTHTLLAVLHLASAQVQAGELQGIPAILDDAGGADLPRARIVVLDGNALSPNQPKLRDGQAVRTIWGELAWQLGGLRSYEQVRGADESGTSPGKDVLAELLAAHAPCVILVDELVRYVAQFEEGRVLAGGSFDSNLSFVQALTEALKAVPNALMLASLPESDREAGSQRGIKALQSLAHYFGRVQALWKPVATEEAFEIVRRRLFADIADKRAVENACRAFAELYVANPTDFPHETQQARYLGRLLQAYPIHPEVFDRLYEDWSSLDNFQRTRGVLKLMAKVIHRLWKDGNNDLLVMPGSLPLYDGDVRNDAIYYLPQGWDPVLEGDIDGERAEATEIESREPLLGSLQACRRAARTIFLGSAPTTASQSNRGIDIEHVLLGAAQPAQPTGRIRDAVARLADRLHYLNVNGNRYWFDTRPNLRREMEDRRKRFQERDDVQPAIRERLSKMFAGGSFGGIHVFPRPGDVPDDWYLRLAVLPTDAGYSKTGASVAIERATEILQDRGGQPRVKQNRLIFLAPDQDVLQRLRDQVRTLLAWQSIVADSRDGRLNLDMYMGRQAAKSLEDAQDGVKRILREAYKWLLVPVQHTQGGQPPGPLEWERVTVNPATQNFTGEIERVLKDNELVIYEWAPVHLSALLRAWFWKADAPQAGAQDVWQKSCCYLYMPRLKDDDVYRRALGAGAPSLDYFGLAYIGPGDTWTGFTYGEATVPMLDGSLVLIEPGEAAAYRSKLQAQPQDPTYTPDGAGSGAAAGTRQEQGVRERSRLPGNETAEPQRRNQKTRFFGVVELDPVTAKRDFATVVDEVLLHFTTVAGAKVRLRVDLEVEAAAPFSDAVMRTVSENARSLRFKGAEFEDKA
jgi:predicted AAA+ superfamily ATPase